MSARDTLRSLTVPVYLPAFLTQAGNGMLIPILPLYLRDVGLSNTELGWVIAAAGFGGVLAQAPAGTLIAKRTARLVILLSVGLMAAMLVALAVSENALWLGGTRLFWGAGSTGWLIGLQTRLTRATEPQTRGRAMATWGGFMRMAVFIGPLLGGLIVDRFSYTASFLVAAGLMSCALIPTARAKPLPPPLIDVKNVGLPTLQAIRPYRLLVAKTGLAHMCLIAARQGRFIVIPLIGAARGLSATEVGSLVAIGAFADLALFPMSGYLMDRHGRLFAIIPAFCGFAAGMVMLGLADSSLGVTVAAIVIGVSNGIGSGTMLTISSDLAPPEATSQFLASVGMIRDAGKILGPLLVGWLADQIGLDASSFSLAALALVGVAIIVFGIGETGSRRPEVVRAAAT